MKKRTPKFHLNEPVYVCFLGHVVKGRIKSISQQIEDEVDFNSGRKKMEYRVSYYVSGNFPFIQKGKTFFTSLTQYIPEDRIFAANEEDKAIKSTENELNEDFICVTNSAYIKMSMLSHVKTDDAEKKEFIKIAYSFCKKLREYNKRKYQKQTPIMGVCRRGNFM